jgi:serine/threonine protein kinase
VNYIGKYEIVSTLGRGSMGVVYKGRDPEIGRLVAIKTLKSVYLGNDPAGNEALQRFRQEARSAGKLHHPNIVTIFEAGRTDTGSPYIVMEFIEGTSVELMLAEQGALDPYAVFHYLAQIASAVDYAHSQNVIHRDLKPSNILIDGWQRAHLLDFGVAKLSDTSLTPAGTVVGTPSYMSPEQIRGQTLDGRTDLFSLAVVAYESLLGVRPFPGNDFTTVVTNIIHKEPLSFREVKSDLPPELEKVLNWGLTKEREERCSNALEFVSALSQVLDVLVDGSGLIGGYNESRKWRSNNSEVLRTISKGSVGGVGSLGLGKAHPEEKESGQSAGEQGILSAPSDPSPGTHHPEAKAEAQPEQKALAREHAESMAFNNEPTQIKEEAPKRKSFLVGAVGIVLVMGVVFIGVHRYDGGVVDTTLVSPGTEEPRGVEQGIATSVQTATSNKSNEPAVEAPPQIPMGGYTKATIVGLSDDELQVLLGWSGTDVETLRLAIPEAGVRGKKDFGASLVGLLGQKDLVVRVETLKALSKPVFVYDEGVFRKLVVLLDDPEPVVRGFAAKAIANAGNAVARDALHTRLKVETSEVVQKVIKDCLTRMGGQ